MGGKTTQKAGNSRLKAGNGRPNYTKQPIKPDKKTDGSPTKHKQKNRSRKNRECLLKLAKSLQKMGKNWRRKNWE